MLQLAKNKPLFTMETMARQYMEQALQELMEGAEFRLLVPVPVLARLLSVNLTRAYELARMEGFPSLKIGKKILCPVVPLLSFLEQQAALPLDQQAAASLGRAERRRR